MKQKNTTSSWSRKVLERSDRIGSMLTISAAALTITLAACDDSSSSPSNDDLDGLSSETITSSETAGDSSESNGNSAPSQDGNSSTSQEGGSSAATGTSSNSSAGNSSNSEKTCAHITDNECRITQGCAMTPCMDGTKTLDCATNLDYVCKGGVWSVAATNSSSSKQSTIPTHSDNCANISGVTGNEKWNCNEEDFTLAKDCNDSASTYMCVSKRWFKTDDCNSAKPNCGYDDYTICLKTKLREYCSKDGWLDEPCNYGEDPIRWLFIYDKPDGLGYDREERYSCNQNGKWEKIVNNCDSGMDCSNNKSDDKGILPDGAPCQNVGEQMTVEGYNYQCINNVWTRL